MDVVTALRQQRMNPFRWYAVALCILCGAIDGLDLLLVAYALPHLPDGFASGGQKGLLISLAFIGYGIGSALIAPMADRIGRKNLVVLGLVFASVVLGITAFAPNVEVMMVTRLLTGLAVGTMLPLVHILGDEYSSQNRRSLSVGIITLGVPIGSLLGGLASLFIISSFDGAWQALFVFGATLSGLTAVVVWLTLPESPVFLANRGSAGDDIKIAAIARRLRLVGVDPSMKPAPEFSPHADDESESSRDAKVGVLSPRYRVRSLLIWGGYTFGILGYYFINSWTPQLITTATDSAATGALVTTVISIGAITGGVLFTLMTLRVIPTKLCWMALGVAVVAQVTFAMTLSGGVAYVAAFILGMGIQAGLSAYMTSATRLYPPTIRARGLGLMGGISRVGSITAPLLVGALLSVVTAEVMYLAASVTVFIAGASAFGLWANTKHEFDEPVVPDHESINETDGSPSSLTRS
ncbi:MFS transporter [Gordonia sp. HNM0687]|uniref:MFS transporter n=1 Tax=Gordonia mangrovi TaxID=2665643 RepID=A0A6L7GTV1_9ACTN|nr:MFS transporter [Gordonia mangrovi]MXP23444.1 MFS transporter [Gordonia mangrovi]UVF76661.1 MFS transporter [Gordonia mangrovi]